MDMLLWEHCMNEKDKAYVFCFCACAVLKKGQRCLCTVGVIQDPKTVCGSLQGRNIRKETFDSITDTLCKFRRFWLSEI